MDDDVKSWFSDKEETNDSQEVGNQEEQPKESKKFPKEVYDMSLLGSVVLLRQTLSKYLEGNVEISKIEEDVKQLARIIEEIKSGSTNSDN